MSSEAISEKSYLAEDWLNRVRLPKTDPSVPQDAEWCEIQEQGSWKRLRFHDYAEIYARPGLYEHLFYGLLQCRSPERVVGLLEAIRKENQAPREFTALDLGAGNGLVGEALRGAGASRVAGVDILPEAHAATERDRPWVYADYLVADLCAPTPEVSERLGKLRPEVLTCVAALGFGDIPPLAYYHAASFVPVGGMLAFNIKEEFLDERYTYGFSELVRQMVREKVVRLEATMRYRHRLSAAGQPLFYNAMVATKLAEIPRSMLVAP